jgi:hypothetical protein
VIGEPTRIKVLDRQRHGPAGAQGLVDAVGTSQQNVPSEGTDSNRRHHDLQTSASASYRGLRDAPANAGRRARARSAGRGRVPAHGRRLAEDPGKEEGRRRDTGARISWAVKRPSSAAGPSPGPALCSSSDQRPDELSQTAGIASSEPLTFMRRPERASRARPPQRSRARGGAASRGRLRPVRIARRSALARPRRSPGPPDLTVIQRVCVRGSRIGWGDANYASAQRHSRGRGG